MPSPTNPGRSGPRPGSRGPIDAQIRSGTAKDPRDATPSHTTGEGVRQTHEEGHNGNFAFQPGPAGAAQMGHSAFRTPGSQQPSGNALAVSRSYRQHNELLGVGAQFNGANIVRDTPDKEWMERVVMCPRHGLVLQKHVQSHSASQGIAPMDRYLAERPSQRYAVLGQRYAEGPVPSQGCRCMEMMHGDDAK